MNAPEQPAAVFDEELESKYEIFDELGGGGMGRVFRARHRQLKRWVAIKLLQQDLRSPEAITRFMREARAAAHIRSVHVAHILDAGILRPGHPFIVMEYLHGQDLAKLIQARGRLPVVQAVEFTLQALEALAEAHTLDIVHRDIKPGNLFATHGVGGDIAIKVVDFGLAKTSSLLDTADPSVTERGAMLGTPSYMSPEQFIDAPNVDARADIWGIGATLFELLTGKPPFTGSNLPQVYTAVMHRDIPAIRTALPELPEALDRVVATCLMRDRELRFSNVAELAAALAPFAGADALTRAKRISNIVNRVRETTDFMVMEAAEPAFRLAPRAQLERLQPTSRKTWVRRTSALGLAGIACVGALSWCFSFSQSTPPIDRVAREPTVPDIVTRAADTELDSTLELPPPQNITSVQAPVGDLAPPSPQSSAVRTHTPVSRNTAKRPRTNRLTETPPSKASTTVLYEKYP